jgi:flagellar hook-length control protein FliK
MQRQDSDAPTGEVPAEQAGAALRPDAAVNAGVPPSGNIVQQIAARITSEAAALTTQTDRTDAQSFTVRQDSPVRVLNIQLQPADLGVVTIRMSVKDQTLRLDLEVGRGETAHLIQRDRETLSALLRSAGYVIDGVQVRVADQAALSAQSPNGQTGTQMQGGNQSGSSQTNARTPDGRPSDGQQNNPFRHGRNGENDQAGHTHRGGIYL